MKPEDQVCMVGQAASEPCHNTPTHVVSVKEVWESVWPSSGPQPGGVFLVCHHHATTPIASWDSTVEAPEDQQG